MLPELIGSMVNTGIKHLITGTLEYITKLIPDNITNLVGSIFNEHTINMFKQM